MLLPTTVKTESPLIVMHFPLSQIGLLLLLVPMATNTL